MLLERRLAALEDKLKQGAPQFKSMFSNNYQKDADGKMLLNLRLEVDTLKQRVKVLESELRKVINEQNKGQG